MRQSQHENTQDWSGRLELAILFIVGATITINLTLIASYYIWQWAF